MTEAAKEAAKFLKNTLRLPLSKFPPRPQPVDIAKYLPRFTDDLNDWQCQHRPATNTFVLHDGPPYANGDLHVGHALNKIVKDIICRTKIAEGKRVNYVPGWDCHGLPIELKALEKHGWQRGQGVDAVAIRSAARSFAHNTVRKQMKGFRSWGVMGDWDNHWKTMDKDFELRQLAIFRAMAQNGLIYRRHKPVHWSPSSRTALAEAELEYKDDHISTAAFVKFRLPAVVNGLEQPVHALIWTTTPWTIPANQAIAINKGLDYVLTQSQKHGNLIIARSRVLYVQEQIQEALHIVKSIGAEELLNSTYSGLHHFGEDALNRPIIHADFVSPESGTGLVHCAPGHGADDYEALQPLIRSGSVSVKAPVDDGGLFTDTACPVDPSLLKGKNVFSEGNETVLLLLKEQGVLVSKSKFRHKYPIDWRTKEPVMTRATAQWFADISTIKNDTLASLKAVFYLPSSGESRLRSFVENRSEWCISRQRAWGVPIPALYHKETGEALLTNDSINHVIQVIGERGIDAWWSDPADDPAWVVNGYAPSDYIRGKDTMDVWFDSGTSWSFMTNLGDWKAQEQPLADVYLEGSDQHRGWFQSSLLTNVAYQKSVNPGAVAHAPFKQLITHGFTLDGEGKKMSKSVGNVINPDEIIAGLVNPKAIQPKTSKTKRPLHPLGPDALRLWAASSDWTKDVVISDKVVSTVHTSLDKYRVTFKLLLGMLADFGPRGLVSYDETKQLDSQLDRVALLQLYQVVETVRKAFVDFEFHKAVSVINEWIARDLSGFYFEAIKDVVYCDSPTGSRRRSAQTVLYHTLSQMQYMLGPLCPLLVEEAYDHTPEAIREMSEHPLRRVWTEPPTDWNDQELARSLKALLDVNSSVKSAQEEARAQKLLGQSLASNVIIDLRSDDNASLLSKISTKTWKEILVVSHVDVLRAGDPDIVTEKEAGWQFRRNLAGNGEVAVIAPTKGKCARCWTYDVEDEIMKTSSDVKLPLCNRCEDAVAEHQKSVV